jgi:hypothetical protein
MTARLLIVLLVAGLAWPSAARADGDPASDVLLQQDAYYPYAPPTSPRLRKALDGLLARARAAGYPMKVALIQTVADLGAYSSRPAGAGSPPQSPDLMFSHPQRYADQLSYELLTIRHGNARNESLHLLVVFPSGFSGKGLGDHVDEALAPLSVDAAAQADGLAQAAMRAVARIATAEGHRLAVPPEAQVKLAARNESTKPPSGPSILVFIVPSALAIAGALVASLLSRRKGSAPEG